MCLSRIRNWADFFHFYLSSISRHRSSIPRDHGIGNNGLNIVLSCVVPRNESTSPTMRYDNDMIWQWFSHSSHSYCVQSATCVGAYSNALYEVKVDSESTHDADLDAAMSGPSHTARWAGRQLWNLSCPDLHLCGHQCFCTSCATEAEQQGRGCPVCHTQINIVLRLF